VKRLRFLFILLAYGCHSSMDHGPYSGIGENLPMILADTAVFQQMPLASRAAVRSFYASRDFSLFWSNSESYRPSADSLVAAIRKTGTLGLIEEDYHLQAIERILADSIHADRLRMDVLLTDAFLTLHQHLRKGRLHPATFQRFDLSTTTDAVAIASLERVHGTSISAEIHSLEPKTVQYRLLKRALSSYRLARKEDSVEQARARTIALNMERWRWQKAWPDRYVLVNVPAFSLRVFEGDSLWLETPVIVGKRKTPTPVLESIIRSFTIYPYWHVPRSISTEEILPSLQADASYLQRNNFDVLDRDGVVIRSDTIQWKSYNAEKFPFILRQREGTENSMGIIKFNFANNYNVYLHDTNSKRLFTYRKRDLSHGCVRVKEAVALAHYLVREDDIYVSPEDLDQYLSLQQRLNIDLRKPIVVRLEYFTAQVENGNTRFYDDIYGKDSVMHQVLYHQSRPSVAQGERPSL
jgi:murein L,D-transpeptidase YcbB/YkuD